MLSIFHSDSPNMYLHFFVLLIILISKCDISMLQYCQVIETYKEIEYKTVIYPERVSWKGFFGNTKWETRYKKQLVSEWVPKERKIETCCTGYSRSLDNKCEPICHKGCLNGYCHQPGKCTCFVGYTLNVTEPHLCRPICGFHNCGIFGSCIAPNVCSCPNGYESHLNEPCTPICIPPCENAECIAPNKCECNNGYSKEGNLSHECQPICQPKCFNAICVSPDKCVCLPGYKKSLSFANECIAECVPSCIGPEAYCASPGKCVCQQGYKLNGDQISCRPVCSKDCENGYCNAPNTCICNQFYEPDDDMWHKCVPTCSLGCFNANCTAPDNCTCYEGHELDLAYETEHVCVPTCQLQCINGNCTAPDECTCFERYVKDENVLSGHVCTPVCQKPCEGSYCEEPDVCTCFGGYTQITETHCELNCSRECVATLCEDYWIPESCTCPVGYSALGDGGRCIANCLKFCHWSDVSCLPEPLCHCQVGSIPNEFAICDNLCPHCDPDNGRCDDFGQCKCRPGFFGNNCSQEEACSIHADNKSMACLDNKCGCEQGWQGPCHLLNENCYNFTELYNISTCTCITNKTDSMKLKFKYPQLIWVTVGGSILAFIFLSVVCVIIYRCYGSHQRQRVLQDKMEVKFENDILTDDNDFSMN